ncbi:SMP-30/gluconolactonase/LRE family protein [Actinocrispum wychmicini]|uniref:Sugar lactone lactonase YvrE n=1 Tax=Actinocrispum wychmicini TaxID=1213861 RepID=A0A4R2JG89_9PSEU|nr:SMP-30/gluconolactonase/LRE family protein [Actinocrispum wychmicini]TCO55888.1 sugar lactone lactonase YvrE [Actinocrispum wychmicini]
MTTGRIFIDGTLGEPRLDHPEGLAVHPDGSVWCGGEAGQIYRIDAEGTAIEVVANTNGFILGVAFGPDGALYACDIAHRAVFRVATGKAPEVVLDGAEGRRFTNPNSVVFDPAGRMYVSDSRRLNDPGPAIFVREPSGAAAVWYGDSLAFANGLALDPSGAYLYVAESFLPGVSRIPVGADGAAGPRETVVTLPGCVPDGLAFGPDGLLYIACYEPSQILRVQPDGTVATVLADPTAHLLCHPTNIAFRGTTLFAANLGRWHLTAIEHAVVEEKR